MTTETLDYELLTSEDIAFEEALEVANSRKGSFVSNDEWSTSICGVKKDGKRVYIVEAFKMDYINMSVIPHPNLHGVIFSTYEEAKKFSFENSLTSLMRYVD